MVIKVKLVDIMGYNGLVMTSEDSRFKDDYGEFIEVGTSVVFRNMCEISNWCKNTFGEKCEFEVGQ